MAIVLVIVVTMVLVNMAYTGVRAPSHGIIAQGDPPHQILKVETATNMYPGRWVTKGTNGDDIIVGALDKNPVGWLGYERTPNQYLDGHSEDTIYTASDKVAVYYGGRFCIVASLAAGFSVYKGDGLVNWSDGQLAGPCEPGDGGVWLKIPFTKNTSEKNTAVVIPADMVVKDVLIDVTTAAGSSTIDVGLLSSEAGGDADGFVDGASCASAVKLRPGATVTTGSNEVYVSATTRGVLLVDTFTAGTDVATDVGTYFEKVHRTDGTAKTISYTTSDHTVAGNIWILLQNPTLKVIAIAEEDKDASAAAADVVVRSLI